MQNEGTAVDSVLLALGKIERVSWNNTLILTRASVLKSSRTHLVSSVLSEPSELLGLSELSERTVLPSRPKLFLLLPWNVAVEFIKSRLD